MVAPIGLIAGDGRFPRELAQAARRSGRRVVAVAFRELSDPELAAHVDELHWLHLGELGALLETLSAAGVRDAVLAGKVAKTHLYADPVPLRPDALALEILGGLRDRGDDSILAALAGAIEARGIRLLPQSELAPGLLAGPGVLGATAATPAQLGDLAFGWPVAKALAARGIGQTVVVRDRAIVALEAVEGTDEAIRRGGHLAGPGASVSKVPMADPDLRFDLPALGPGTLSAMSDVGAVALGFEADRTLLLDRERLLRQADEHGIALVGFSSAGPLARAQNGEDE